MNIRELAEMAGTSHMTVSRALNGSPRIAVETRERILQLARDHGYRINAGAKGLATGILETIGMLYPYQRLRPQASWYTTQLMHRIRAELLDRGFDTMIAGYDTADEDVTDITRLVAQKKVDGLIISGHEISEAAADALHGVTERYLLVNPPHESWLERHPCLMIDQAGGGALAARALREAGRTRIAAVAERTKQYMARIEGLGEALRRSGIGFEAERDLFAIPTGSYEGAYELARSKGPELLRYEALFVGCDLQAIGVVNGLKDLGISVPKDIAVVGFDDIEWARYVRPSLTTVHQPCSEVAAAAADEIVERVLGGKKGPLRKMFNPTLIRRESC